MKTLIAVIGLSTAFSATAADGPLPQPYSATYEARFAGLKATAYRELNRLEGANYELVQGIEVRVLGASLGEIEESSRFGWKDNLPVPDYYSYNQSGISSQEEAVEFDWQSSRAFSFEDDDRWTLELTPGVQDKLSFQEALRWQLTQQRSGDMVVSMVDSDEIEHHLYRIGETEVIDTGLGPLEAVRVDRVRDEDDDRRTSFWLATDWDFLLVRLVQTSGSGSQNELMLQAATVNGLEVTSLP